MSEIVYILTNDSMDGYIKIGRTKDLESRMRQLDNTSTPLPFECFCACIVEDAVFVERQMHEAFKPHRTRSNREFFEMSPVRAEAVLKLVALEDVTPSSDYVETEEDQNALDKARAKRSNFNFRMLDIPIGSKLTFIKDKTIEVEVIDNKNIKFGEEITTTSAAARQLLNSKWGVQGPLYWVYEGETLQERRLRLERE